MSLAEHGKQFNGNAAWQGGMGDVADFFQLLKPRVMSLVVFTAFVGIYLAPGDLHPLLALVGLLCIAVGAGASGALNMWYDADIDCRMDRTRNRPIPAGRITDSEALAFGMVLSVASVFILGTVVNWLSAGLLAFTIFFYAVIYTMWLKRRTQQNIVIGGAAGAFPPMIGWAVATGSVGLESILLFLIIFVWTPPHFWALALLKSGDYRNAGVPMMPVVSGADFTRNQILLYSLLLLPVGAGPYLIGFAGIGYGIVSIVLGVTFAALAFDLRRRKQESEFRKPAAKLFSFSIMHLFLLFLVLLCERLLGWSG